MNCPHPTCTPERGCQFPDRCYDNDKKSSGNDDALGRGSGSGYVNLWDDPYYRSSDYRDGPGRDSCG